MAAGIPALTGLRFVAAAAVLIAHSLPNIVPLPQNQAPSVLYTLLVALSGQGMTLFFVLSGFVIHYNYADQILSQGARGFFNFFVARFARLYPLYFVCLSFEILLKYSFATLPNSLAEIFPYYATLTFSWFYVPFGDNALIYQLGPIAPVAWSISTEWFFYLVYPLICYGLVLLPRTRDKLRAAIVVCLVATCLVVFVGHFATPINNFAIERFGAVADIGSHWQDSFLRWLVSFSPYSRIFEFILGCLAAAIYMDWVDRTPTDKEERCGLYVLATAIVTAGFLHVFFFTPSILPAQSAVQILHAHLSWLNLSFGFAPPIAIIIFCCARYKSALARLLSKKRVILCGEASYSIYLLHLFVIYAFRWEAAPFTSFQVLIGDALRLGLTFLTVIGLSLVMWSLVEVPARRWLRTFMIASPRTAFSTSENLSVPERSAPSRTPLL
jgi:peptidoglycan/LPS O-acetylase OafA/YrhL